MMKSRELKRKDEWRMVEVGERTENCRQLSYDASRDAWDSPQPSNRKFSRLGIQCKSGEMYFKLDCTHFLNALFAILNAFVVHLLLSQIFFQT
jgi:hypothetical protein